MTDPTLLGLTDAARIAHVTTGALRRAARMGTLEAVRVGARTYAVTQTALAAYMAYTSQRGWLTDPARRPGRKTRRRPRT